ncbi:hypothetical protein DYB28_002131 [Aphanomyces astaci]|uniref:Uncharacterized protein n=1 Tax=Aphanomyces astaci TaxID=112090 RepID=A0A9X8HAC0_APHAT|nr:hypothetical protein DYB28_002131 [Aphanomyces astaci]
MSVTIRTWEAIAVTAARCHKFGTRRDPSTADIFGLDQGRKTLLREYHKYLGQINALQCNGWRPSMPVSACMDPFSKRRIALVDFKFNCVTLDTTCGPLVLRGLKAWVDDASTATELIVSRPVMELLGFSVEDFLVGARKKKKEWNVSSVPTNQLSGMANVKRLMAEKLNPPEFDPDDGMECATPEVYPKTSVEDEAERHRTKQGDVQAI